MRLSYDQTSKDIEMTLTIIETDGSRSHQSFNKARYLNSDAMAAEYRAIWSNSWLMAGLVQDVQNPGDFFVFEIGSEQILISRDQQGQLHGFYNVCQHRGNLLMGTGHGNATHFRCSYHAWTYDLDGALKGVPLVDKFVEDPRCANRD